MATATKSTHYEIRYIPVGGGCRWVKLCSYTKKDDPVLLSNYEVYKNSKIISKVEVVEVVKTTETIHIDAVKARN